MKAIQVENRSQIELLLSCDYVLAVKDDRYHSFGGCQLWWYDHEKELCMSCGSRWTNMRKVVESHSLKEAAKTLWRKRRSLFLRTRKPPHRVRQKQLSYS